MPGLIVVLTLAVIIGAICGLIALVKLTQVQARLTQVEQQLLKLRTMTTQPVKPQVGGSESALAVTEPPKPETGNNTLPITALWQAEQQTESAQLGSHNIRSEVNPRPATLAPPQPTQSWLSWIEQQLIERGMVWLGGLALAFGGIFLVRHSLEAGWFTPVLRIASGLLFGCSLIVASEYLHRKRTGQQSFENYIPAALASAGFITLYAALLMALQWYQLLNAGFAFGLMALVALAASWFSLRQGPILAVIGILGAYLVPVLVNTGSSDLAALLAYLAAITCSSVLVERRVQRPWLWFFPILALCGWLLLLVVHAQPADSSLLLAAIAASFVGLVWLPPLNYRPVWHRVLTEQSLPLKQWLPLPREQVLGLVLLALVLLLGWQTATVLTFFNLTVLLAIFYLTALTNPRAELWLWAALLPLLSWVWQTASLISVPPVWYSGVVLEWQLMLGLLLLFLLPVSRLAPQRLHWSVILALAPLLLLVVSYQQLVMVNHLLQLQGLWMFYGALLVIVQALLAKLTRSPAQAFVHSAGANLALSWCFTLYLSVAALTVALAMQLIVMTLLSVKQRFPLPHWVVKALVVVILLRLTSAPLLGSYEEISIMGWHWSLVIYPLVLLCMFAASMLWRNTALQPWLVGAGLQLVAVFLTVQGQYWLQGQQLDFSQQNFYTLCLHSANWLTLAVIYQYRSELAQAMQPLYRFAAAVLVVLALGAQAILQLTLNPFFTEQQVGSWPILNWLLLLWFIPALCLTKLAAIKLPNRYYPFGYYLAAGFLTLFIIGSVRQYWQGAEISWYLPTSNAEHYSYSAVFLLLASVLVAVTQYRQWLFMRKAGFVLLCLVVAKVFIFDLNQLSGLYRAASFIGLGLCLVLLSALFQHLQRRTVLS